MWQQQNISVRTLPHEDKDGWKGFASELLTIVPMLLSFLNIVVAPMRVMERHIESFRLLDRLLKLFSLGAESSMPHLALIERTIAQHARLFNELYSSVVKPKAHHIFHIPDHMRNLGRLLSCFVTERKHRSVKAVASHAFRHFENALIREMLNSMVEQAAGETNLYTSVYLEHPRGVAADALSGIGDAVPGMPANLFTSTKAVLMCGHLARGDLVMTSARSVGEITTFVGYKTNDSWEIWCVIHCRASMGAGRYAVEPSAAPSVIPASEILAPLCWCIDGDGIRVLPPAVSATW